MNAFTLLALLSVIGASALFIALAIFLVAQSLVSVPYKEKLSAHVEAHLTAIYGRKKIASDERDHRAAHHHRPQKERKRRSGT